MKVPWVNLLLLLLLLAQTVTGYFGFTNGRESSAWILALHGIIAYALLLLLFFKADVIRDAWRRKKRWTARRIGFVITLALLALTLLLGLLWTFQGPLYLVGFSLVSLHIYVAVPLMLLMLWHAWHMRFIRRVPGATGRRLFLGGLGAAVGGLLLWAGAGRARAAAGLRGAARRFTGSYETGSFTPDFPVVSWIADRPPPVDAVTWRLRVEGAWETLEAAGARLDPLRLRLDGGEYRGSARVPAGGPAAGRPARFDLQGGKLDLRRYLRPKEQPGEPFTLPVEWLRAQHLEGVLELEEAHAVVGVLQGVRITVLDQAPDRAPPASR